MGITLSSALPYLLVGAGYLVRHYDLVGKALSLFGLAAGPNPLTQPPTPTPPPPASPSAAVPSVSVSAHPILSDAVNAAIKQAVADVSAGHIASLATELKAVAAAAATAAVADLKAKV